MAEVAVTFIVVDDSVLEMLNKLGALHAQYSAKPGFEERAAGVSDAIEKIGAQVIEGVYSVEELTPCDYQAWRDAPQAKVLVKNDDVFVAIIPGRNAADYVGVWISQ